MNHMKYIQLDLRTLFIVEHLFSQENVIVYTGASDVRSAGNGLLITFTRVRQQCVNA